MKFAVGQIVKVTVADSHLFGRVTKVDRHGDGEAMFASKFSPNIIHSAIMPEMVADAFYFEGKGRYGV